MMSLPVQWGSLSTGGLCPGEGSFMGDLCAGRPLKTETPRYGKELVGCILLECILVGR